MKLKLIGMIIATFGLAGSTYVVADSNDFGDPDPTPTPLVTESPTVEPTIEPTSEPTAEPTAAPIVNQPTPEPTPNCRITKNQQRMCPWHKPRNSVKNYRANPTPTPNAE